MPGSRVALISCSLVFSLSACTCGGSKLKPVEYPDLTDAGCAELGNCPGSCVASAETCNGRDDDCDGVIDEELPPLSCGVGGCRREVPSCVGGVTSSCTPGAPGAETCNGVDDDCNGAVDENLMPAMCGVGECAAVQPSCANGQPAACMPGAPQAEQCNGKDDNCDGTVDEGLLANTSGELRITNNPAGSDFVYIGQSPQSFGVVWQDKRDGTKGQIYFAGLDKQGQRLGTSDTRVSFTQGNSAHPAVAWNGQRWGLVYSDDGEGNVELYFRPLSATGAPQGQAVRLTNATGDSDWPDLVWTGSAFAVAYDDERAGANKHDIYFQRFDTNGTRLGGEVRVTTDPNRQSSPILKWNGTEFGVAWTDFRFAGNREVYFRRLAPDGMPLGNELRITNNAADQAWPDLAWNDVSREWGIVWHDSRDGNAEIYFARLDASGARIGNEVRLTNAAGFSGYPSIDWNGFQYGVSWQDERVTAGKPAIYFAQVSARGAKNGADLKLSNGPGSSTYTTALWNGSTFAFCWRDDRDTPAGNTEIYFSYVGCPR